MARIEVAVTDLEQRAAPSDAEYQRTLYNKLVNAGIPMKGFWRVTSGTLKAHQYPFNGCTLFTWTDEEAK